VGGLPVPRPPAAERLDRHALHLGGAHEDVLVRDARAGRRPCRREAHRRPRRIRGCRSGPRRRPAPPRRGTPAARWSALWLGWPRAAWSRTLLGKHYRRLATRNLL